MNQKEGQFTAFVTRSEAVDYVQKYNENLQLSRGSQPSAYTHSFGCQQNVADGETLEGLLLEMGYTFAGSAEEADVVLFNTCAVRENAENTVFGNVGELKHAKVNNPHMIIGICGCMTQQKHIADQIRESYPFVDILFGSGTMDKLPQLLAECLSQGKRVFQIDDPTKEMIEDLPVRRESGVRAFVPIMTGCNNFCSYCIVPYVRGRERSRRPNYIIEEVKQLVAEGFKEITLLGQNVNSYGLGLTPKTDFVTLLEEISQISGKYRIRFMTSHPKDCTPELIDTIAKHDCLSQHLHLPVQSGSNAILKAMNRGYTVESYLELINYAKKVAPVMTFTSDLIVGFPGETEDDFQATMNLVEKVGYSSLFTFAYSSRQGTKAAEMDNTLTQDEKTKRFERLLALQRTKANEYHSTLVGKTIEVLVDGLSTNREGFLSGRTDSNVIVLFQGGEDLVGEFISVTITNYMNWAIEGQLVK